MREVFHTKYDSYDFLLSSRTDYLYEAKLCISSRSVAFKLKFMQWLQGSFVRITCPHNHTAKKRAKCSRIYRHQSTPAQQNHPASEQWH